MPGQPMGATLCSLDPQHHSALGRLAQGNSTAVTEPKPLESKGNAKWPREWWGVRLTVSHSRGLSKVDFCVLPRPQKGREERRCEGFLMVTVSLA